MYQSIKGTCIGKKEITRRVKMCSPIVTIGCESWVLTETLKTQLQSMEMKYLRQVIGQNQKRGRKTNWRADKIERGQLRWTPN